MSKSVCPFCLTGQSKEPFSECMRRYDCGTFVHTLTQSDYCRVQQLELAIKKVRDAFIMIDGNYFDPSVVTGRIGEILKELDDV